MVETVLRSGRKAVHGQPSDLGSASGDFLLLWAKMAPVEQAEEIRKGMDAVMIQHVARDVLHVTTKQLLTALRLPSTTVTRRISEGDRLNASESDRVARVLYVVAQAAEVFEDASIAAQWIVKTHAELDGYSPLDVLDTQPGYDRVRDILVRLEHGVGV